MSAEPSDRSAARERLDRVNARIAAHPLSSDEFRRAREVVAGTPSQEREQVEAALRAENLPSLRTQTRMMFLGLASLARLNRKRIALEQAAGSGSAG